MAENPYLDVGSIRSKRSNYVKRSSRMECDSSCGYFLNKITPLGNKRDQADRSVSKNPTTTDRGRCAWGQRIGTNVGVQRTHINKSKCVIVSGQCEQRATRTPVDPSSCSSVRNSEPGFTFLTDVKESVIHRREGKQKRTAWGTELPGNSFQPLCELSSVISLQRGHLESSRKKLVYARESSSYISQGIIW